MEVAGSFVELWPGEPGEPERPLLNHLGVLVASADEWKDRAEEAGAEIADVVDAPNTLCGVRLGPRAREARVRRAQAELLARVTVVVAGAGMAGLVTAARLRELGLSRRSLEKGDRPGGSMLLSSGVVWRHRSLAEFRAECPGGDPGLQALVVEQLDERLDWLESLGAEPTARETRNPLTVGRRFQPDALVAALLRSAGDVRLGEPLGDPEAEPVVLATGGFAAALARRLSLPLRASPWSEGDGFALARRRGAAATRGMDEFYGRALPAARVGEADFVRLAQVYGRHAYVVDETGATIDSTDRAWHENDLVQEIARRPAGRAWYLVTEETLDLAAGDTTVRERIDAARAAGGTVVPPGELDFPVPSGHVLAVHVTASVTHTIGGIAVDREARVIDDEGSPIEGLYAAGVDVGGVATGGYASGLAAALVLGCVAAESIAGLEQLQLKRGLPRLQPLSSTELLLPACGRHEIPDSLLRGSRRVGPRAVEPLVEGSELRPVVGEMGEKVLLCSRPEVDDARPDVRGAGVPGSGHDLPQLLRPIRDAGQHRRNCDAGFDSGFPEHRERAQPLPGRSGVGLGAPPDVIVEGGHREAHAHPRPKGRLCEDVGVAHDQRPARDDVERARRGGEGFDAGARQAITPLGRLVRVGCCADRHRLALPGRP